MLGVWQVHRAHPPKLSSRAIVSYLCTCTQPQKGDPAHRTVPQPPFMMSTCIRHGEVPGVARGTWVGNGGPEDWEAGRK